MYFPIVAPDDSLVYPIRNGGTEGVWRFGEATVLGLQEQGNLDFAKDKNGNWVVYRKIREGKERISAAVSLLLDQGTSATGTIEIKEIFGEKAFNTSKPTALIKYLLEQIVWKDKDAIILDSFAGSGTTAQAVLALNKTDGGNRKFILVECEDYADTITAERVRRVIQGVLTAKDQALKTGFGGTFSYFELGKPLEITKILKGNDLPDYKELARYIFYTATGAELDENKIDIEKHFIGESCDYQVYLFYQPYLDYLKSTALTLDVAKSLGDFKGKKRLVFAPTKYLDSQQLQDYHIEFAQLPFEIYKLAK